MLILDLKYAFDRMKRGKEEKHMHLIDIKISDKKEGKVTLDKMTTQKKKEKEIAPRL